MSRRKNMRLFAAIRVIAQADASLPEVITLAANGAATRAAWAIRPQQRLEMEEGCSFIMKVRLCDRDDAPAIPPGFGAKPARGAERPAAAPRSRPRPG